MVFLESKYNSNIQNVFFTTALQQWQVISLRTPQVNFFDIMLKREGQSETEVASFKS